MSKKPKSPTFEVPQHHQTGLRLLLAQRAIAQAKYKAAQDEARSVLSTYEGALHEFVVTILEEAGLDGKVYGIDKTLAKFVLLPPPQSNPMKVDPVPSTEVAQNVAEVKERSGKDDMKVPE